jgi:ABC-type glycerol-3-phosphate transport system substrate-binding protein
MKHSIKKVLSVLLVAVFALSMFTACAKKEETKATEPTAAPVATEAAADPTATPVPTEVPKDLGGMEITIANWWETDKEPTTQKEEDTLAYRNEIMEKYNFKVKTINLGSWTEYQEIVVSSIMAGDPAADIFVMDQKFMAAPLQQGLLYPLDTLQNFDFTEEKWNQEVLDLITFDGHKYGMAVGKMEPRLGIFFNKRLFEEAGIDPELPYDMQKDGTWTWAAFEDLCAKLTRDTNNDGTPDVYGLASFSKDFFRGTVYSNGAQYIGKDDKGVFFNATNDPKFLEALEWGISLYDAGYHMPQPEGSNWDWFIQPFIEGKVAMQCAEEYKVNTWKDMEDDWGFVIFPKGPNGEMMTVFTENIVVMPAGLDAEYAENVAFAYNLYTNTTPGYEDEDWRANYYSVFRDARAVEETLPLFYEPEHGTMSYLPLINGIDYGNVTYDLDARALTPAESVEKVQQQWQTFLDQANGLETVAE